MNLISQGKDEIEVMDAAKTICTMDINHVKLYMVTGGDKERDDDEGSLVEGVLDGALGGEGELVELVDGDVLTSRSRSSLV